jgi:hypothetical protein
MTKFVMPAGSDCSCGGMLRTQEDGITAVCDKCGLPWEIKGGLLIARPSKEAAAKLADPVDLLAGLKDVSHEMRNLENSIKELSGCAMRRILNAPVVLHHDVKTSIQELETWYPFLKNVTASPVLGSLTRTMDVLKKLDEWFTKEEAEHAQR